MKNTFWLLALLIGGCSVLPSSTPLQSWSLTPAPVQTEAAVHVTELRILRLQANELLSSPRILVKPEGQPLQVYKGARWSAAPPILLRDYLADALQRDARFSKISTDEIQLRARYELVSRLLAFHSEYRQGRPVVVIRLAVQLANAADRRILAERYIERTQPAASETLADVTQAFSTLLAQVVSDLQNWLIATVPDAAPD